MATRPSRFPTRILLSAAALGAAGGVYVVALNWASVLTGAIAYYIYAATIALWALPVFVAQALLRHVNFDVVKCIIIASPGFVRDQFMDHLIAYAQKQGSKVIVDNRSKFLLTHSSSGFKHSLKEVV